MMPRFGLILFLVLDITVAKEEPEPAFQTVGESLEMGFCFGVDYIAVYRVTDYERLLLGNSSDPLISPEPYRNRINFTNEQGLELLGMQIEDLTASDSGVYESECWLGNKIESHHQRHLYVCDKKIHSQDILSGQNGDANLVCNISNFKKGSISIKWFGEMNHGHKQKLVLDTKRSLELQQEELIGLLQVQDEGFSLHVLDATQSKTYNFYCLVMDGEQCKSFQKILLQESIDAEPVYFGLGEKAVLPCKSKHLNQKRSWRTPVGEVNSTTSQTNEGLIASQMYISNLEEAEDYSLVIPYVTTNHSGDYSCFSPSLNNKYSVTVCSKLLSSEMQVHAGETVTMNCTLPLFDLATFLWYRQRHSNEVDLLFDLEVSETDPMEDRMQISASDASLTITEFAVEDSGTYLCVVLLDSSELDNNDEDETADWIYKEDTYMCTFKQVIQLKINPRKSSEPESNPPSYAAIGGVLGLVILGLIVAVVVLRIKAKRKAQSPNGVELLAEHKDLSSPITPLKNLHRNSEDVC